MAGSESRGSWAPSMGAGGKDESHASVPQPYFPIKFKKALLVAVQKEPENLPTPADQSEKRAHHIFS